MPPVQRGARKILNLLVRRLIQIGVSPADLAIIFATGIHRPVTPDEKDRTPITFHRAAHQNN